MNRHFNTKTSPEYNHILLAEDQFRQAMHVAGINYSGEIIGDGQLHRFHIEGHKQCTLNGAYTLHLDNHPAGWFMDFTTGLSQTWSSGGSKVSNVLILQIESAKKQREVETRERHNTAAARAKWIWQKSQPISDPSHHPYLVKKRIQPHGVRIHGDALAIPIFNESDELVNLQFINSRGEKRFLSGGRKRGCFHILGDLTKKILICEGFATGASLFEYQNQRVVVAFDAHNLLPVSKNIREIAPDHEIILCADNDLSGTGQTKATEAALAIHGKLIVPPTLGQDWNDYLTGGRQYA